MLSFIVLAAYPFSHVRSVLFWIFHPPFFLSSLVAFSTLRTPRVSEEIFNWLRALFQALGIATHSYIHIASIDSQSIAGKKKRPRFPAGADLLRPSTPLF